ncbi:MAG: cation:proton antiporter [Gemmatimonadetes bacterium]|nr:cation:proton antiporter [Gemmatimonadota bacterium]
MGNPMSAESFLATIALIGAVILIAALLSGLIDRTGLPQVVLFLLLGAALGPAGLGLVSFTLESPSLKTIATVGLVLVLFSDAVTVDVKRMREHGRLATLVLGPGTLAAAALTAVAAWGILGLGPATAAILGAALASTDPVMMRGLLRRGDIPPAARQALGLESGLNDIVLLPIVLVAMVFLDGDPTGTAPTWTRLGLDLLVLGPGAGIGVGLVAIATLDLVRRRWGVRRDYESLYALGVAFAAYAAAEAVQGSGFLAAFAAGLTVAALDVELCDCFLDYGQATAEMFLLFTFVAFGSGLIWSGISVASGRTVLFAAVALGVRSLVLWIALRRVELDRRSRRLIVWFGPRGLSSLLLVLLPIFGGLAGGQELFATASLVVLLSVVLHGGWLVTIARGARNGERRAGRQAEGEVGRAPVGAVADSERITIDELQRLWDRGETVTILDVRKERAYQESDLQARGAVRLPPDGAAQRAAELALPRHGWLVGYCA